MRTDPNKTDKETIYWTDGHGKQQTREINPTIKVEDFLGTPGYALLVLAANPHLSAETIERYLRYIKGGNNERSLTWIKKRRRLFNPPDYTYNTREDLDGKAAKAVRLMSEYPELSIRDLTVLLKDNGIDRSREWVRIHRCDGVLTTDGS